LDVQGKFSDSGTKLFFAWATTDFHHPSTY
jgi:hypothetical protein